jgi:cytosine deaminase
MQLVAFPQRGLERAGARLLWERALAAGLDVVGGCPYVDSDPAAHLDAVFAAAERTGRPIDLHLDLSDDAASSLVDLVAERTAAHGMAGHVTIGHVTTLAAQDATSARGRLDRLAAAGVALVVLPTTDLYVGGHGEPGWRSLAPVAAAAAAGVRVAIATNNLCNPFAPFGDGSLLRAAWLAGIVQRLGDPAGRALLLQAITATPAAVLDLPAHGPAAGAVADLALVDWPDPATAVLQAPAVRATIRHGSTTWCAPGVDTAP